MSLVPGFRQFACFGPQLPRQNPPDVSVRVPIISAKRVTKFLRRSASVAGSGAEFSERLVATERKKKGRNVAGVDQDELVDPTMLSDPDSFFCEFNGIQIHHKVCHHGEEQTGQPFNSEISSASAGSNVPKVGLPMILLHGFGASVFSWAGVMKPLASLIGSSVLAFDRPAFGLTSRPRHSIWSTGKADMLPLNPYSIAFSVLATLFFIDRLGPEKAVLVGHSAGCLVAVDTYFEYPERIAALILVAPAIFAPLFGDKARKGSQKGKAAQSEDRGSTTDNQRNHFIVIWNLLCRLVGLIVQTAMHVIKGMKDMLGSIYRNILLAVLRSSLSIILVRMIIDKFGIAAVRNSWCDANKITDFTINGYTKPLRAKDWDVSLLEYTLATLTNSGSKTEPPLAARLAEISCPVLIITGDTDRIVPRWNAERLASVIPGATLQVIESCGHLPHEEKAAEFLLAIKKFLQRTFGAPGEVVFATGC
ncbi:unnamed protein product [Spirodela intermedia]|uniref:AB hydrolase-1 domain-containing protein n=1 Tax=Spirodela intermedia TaxID=51605 RepID=A0A7I8KMB1_SPIIN|nr:unnamed protein product [Spirodela intermedia]